MGHFVWFEINISFLFIALDIETNLPHVLDLVTRKLLEGNRIILDRVFKLARKINDHRIRNQIDADTLATIIFGLITKNPNPNRQEYPMLSHIIKHYYDSSDGPKPLQCIYFSLETSTFKKSGWKLLVCLSVCLILYIEPLVANAQSRIFLMTMNVFQPWL